MAENRQAQNPFSKKRGAEEITAIPYKNRDEKEDVVMDEQSPQKQISSKLMDDSMATKNLHSVVNESMIDSAFKNQEPVHTSIEDDWQTLKM